MSSLCPPLPVLGAVPAACGGNRAQDAVGGR
jgi:hypothetical protein